jgi:hypothetical protein
VRWPGAATVLAAAALAACGSDATFTAQELVDEVNAHGAGVRLGEPLSTTQPDIELYAIRLEGEAGASASPATGESSAPTDVHAAGSLTIAKDDDAALAEYGRCETAVSLLCFRAANTVLILEDTIPSADIARVEDAVRDLESD